MSAAGSGNQAPSSGAGGTRNIAGAAGTTSTAGAGNGGALAGNAGAPSGHGGAASGSAGEPGEMSGAAGAATASDRCPNPSEELPGNGTVKCDGGLVHRVSPAACAPFAPSDAELPPSTTPERDECHSDADCSDGVYGDCQPPDTTYFKMHVSNFCVYGCTKDADCDDGSVCDCGSNGGHCRESSCATDSDCDDGYCARFPAGCGASGFACQTADDECSVTADCKQGFECSSPGGGPWRCVLAGCPG